MDDREKTLSEDANEIIKQRDELRNMYRLAKQENTEYQIMIEKLKKELEEAKDYYGILEREIENKNGLIKGLVFAIRANGVSGAEVENVL